jgi:hypothetical protein
MEKPRASGYSATPLAKKLGIKEGSRVHLLAAPKGFARLLQPLPQSAQLEERLSRDTHIVHLFVVRKADLPRQLAELRRALEPNAMLWVSWPKKEAKVPTDVSENVVRAIALPLGFVDVKVCAVDDVWSGLKLVVRKALR